MKKTFVIFALCCAVMVAHAQNSTGLAPRHHQQMNRTVSQTNMRSLQTEAIVALNGTDIGHFTLNNPLSVTGYGVSLAENTNSCEYYNLKYYFATSTSGLKSGFYIVRLNGDNGTVIRKFIKR